MKRLYLIFLLLIVPIVLQAQGSRLVVRGFDVNLSDMRAKSDPVYDKDHRPCALIEIVSASESLHLDGSIVSKEHQLGKWVVYMPEGSEWIDLSAEGCALLHYFFPANKPLLSAHAYVLEVSVIALHPMRTLVMPAFSYNKAQSSYGLMLGFGRKRGGFIHAKTDFNFALNPEFSCDVDGKVGTVNGWFTGQSKKSRFAVTVGYMRQVIEPLYFFIGGGYGSRILAWEMYSDKGTNDYARVVPNSFTGYEAELGLILRFGGFALSAGVQTNQFKYYEANFGIGVMF